VVIAAAIWKRAAADRAQGMADELNLRPAGRAKIFSVAAVNTAGASPTARRIKPVDQPIEAIRQRM
jgi:hypothetical protein